jgi:hypothetical protein
MNIQIAKYIDKVDHLYNKDYFFIASLEQPWLDCLFHRASMSLVVSFLFFAFSFFLASSFIDFSSFLTLVNLFSNLSI